MTLLTDIAIAFALGAATTLTALCIFPLYPNYLSYLSNKFSPDPDRSTYLTLSVLVVSGIMTFMFALGLVFTTLLQSSLAPVLVSIVPGIFVILLIVGVMMLFGVDIETYLPSFDAPEFENSLFNAYGFGLFFGALAISCSPAFIAIFIANILLLTEPLNTILSFLVFGVGIGFPLLAFSMTSIKQGQKFVQILANRQELLNRGTGLILITVSLYYLAQLI